MYLQSLAIRHFRSLFDTEIALKPLTIFIGPNGSGKTNLLKALQFIHTAVAGDLLKWKDYGTQIDNLLWYGVASTNRRPLQLQFRTRFGDDQLSEAEYEALFDIEESLEIFEEKLRIREHHEDWKTLFWRLGNEVDFNDGSPPVHPRSSDSLTLRDTGPGLQHIQGRTLYQHIAGWGFYNLDPAFARNAHFIEPKPSKIPPLAQDASNLSAFLYALHEREHDYFEAVIEAVQRSLELPQGILVEHDHEWGGGSARYVFREEHFKDRLVPPDSMSDGTVRMLAHIALLLADRSASLICLEEPDSGLHPRRMLYLAAALRQGTELELPTGLQRQVIVTTHNPALMDCFNLHEESELLQVYVVDRDRSGRTFFTPVTAEEFAPWLERYRLGEAVRRNFI